MWPALPCEWFGSRHRWECAITILSISILSISFITILNVMVTTGRAVGRGAGMMREGGQEQVTSGEDDK